MEVPCSKKIPNSVVEQLADTQYYNAIYAWSNHKNNEKSFTGDCVINTGFFLSNTGNYKTIVVDILPHLQKIETPVNIIISNDEEKNKPLLDYIDLFNIKNITFLQSKDIKTVEKLTEMVYPTYPENRSEFFSFWWLMKLRSLIIQPYSFKKIIIERKYDRHIPNDILCFLSKQGFKRFILEEMDVSDQINLFAGAEQIVMAHGAGMINTVYCSNNCRILELSTGFNIDYYRTYIEFINSHLSPNVNLIYDQILSDSANDTEFYSSFSKRKWYLKNRACDTVIHIDRFTEKFGAFFL